METEVRDSEDVKGRFYSIKQASRTEDRHISPHLRL